LATSFQLVRLWVAAFTGVNQLQDVIILFISGMPWLPKFCFNAYIRPTSIQAMVLTEQRHW